MVRAIPRRMIQACCKIVILKQALRWCIRRQLHSARLPGCLRSILTRMSGMVPVDDIE